MIWYSSRSAIDRVQQAEGHDGQLVARLSLVDGVREQRDRVNRPLLTA
jgi:hypothetical protein